MRLSGCLILLLLNLPHFVFVFSSGGRPIVIYAPPCFQISSVGALLDHLTRERAVGELDDEGLEGLEIRDIEVVTLSVDGHT